jgi:FkbM family methyltransferase
MTRPQEITLPADGFNALAMCRTGPILYNRHDMYVGASLRKYGEFSEGETELFRQLIGPGALVVEGGANIGAHTVSLSRMVGGQGNVLAFEPQRIVFQTLCANLALNSCANVRAFQCGLGSEPGEIIVPFLDPALPANFGGLSLLDVETGEPVRLATIDELGLTTCQMIKLDVEGMEVEALKGAARTIAAHRPLMYVENDRPARSSELVALLLSWRYRLYWHTPPLYSPNNFAGDPENIFGNICSMNLLCLPGELQITVNGLTELLADGLTPA